MRKSNVMKLTKKEYTVSQETVKKCLNALGNNWFYSTEEGDFNNDDIVEADKTLTKEIMEQENKFL